MFYIVGIKGQNQPIEMMLCKDNKLRRCPNFGTYKECIKVYKRQFYAEKIANKWNDRSVHFVQVFEFEDNVEIDGWGNQYKKDYGNNNGFQN